ncbi:DUF1579 domain-containing protein [Stieleria sp. TO1_6]|uniref:DUF1579 domain-containing protein n=1 Tax=Stieleria tagensis TaxID=2956795 RepID=UPI00209A9B01|nr:DUF1579 domain-containing protein [Stieleria tagensis]MCO8122414.1 DUF1579 domain-containing protein [Stieleria tagensis]
MKPAIVLLILFVIATRPANAQPPQLPTAEKEHAWLQKFNGQWESNSKSIASDQSPEVECTGSMSSRMLGEFWVINRFEGEAGGQSFQAIQTIGYDTTKKKYVGSWVDSMLNHMWQYSGTVSEDGKRLELVADGPNFMDGGKLTKFRDSYEFQSPDVCIATSEIQNEDGKWTVMMQGKMTRVK